MKKLLYILLLLPIIYCNEPKEYEEAYFQAEVNGKFLDIDGLSISFPILCHEKECVAITAYTRKNEEKDFGIELIFPADIESGFYELNDYFKAKYRKYTNDTTSYRVEAYSGSLLILEESALKYWRGEFQLNFIDSDNDTVVFDNGEFYVESML